jgi:hypothetical protein
VLRLVLGQLRHVFRVNLFAGHKLKPLDCLGTYRSEVLLQQLKFFIAYVIERTALLNLALLRQKADDRREMHLRLSFTDASTDIGTVLGEVFMQQRKGKLIELAARPNRPP